MTFAVENGYAPRSISDLMALVRAGVNQTLSTSYDEDTFVGTNLYKFYYALIQRLQENEVRTSEIVLKLQQYFRETNEAIVRPNTTNPGLIDYLTAAGFLASVKEPIEADAGKVFVCVDLDDGADDYDEKKLEVCGIIRDSVVAGVVSQGDEVETLALSNSQSFDFKFNLPDRQAIELRLTLTVSENNQFTILGDDEVAQILFDNVNARYRLGLAFEPQRYFSVLDAPWCAAVLLEYSTDGGSMWSDDIFDAEYDDLFEFELADISIVVA